MAKNDVITIPKEESNFNSLPVSARDVENMKKQRELLRDFVGSQLVEADFKNKDSPSYGEGDYGIIPGTKKRCLFKQGAEKMQKLFGLGIKFELVDKELDRAGNFAMFTYKAKVYALRNPDVTIAECDGSVNSQEVKYKTRTVWRKKKVAGREVSESITEETPVCDVLNTLQKMAQKRAMIGATILATGASEYFTQDVLEPEDVAKARAQDNQDGKQPGPKSVPEGAEENGAASEPVSDSPPMCCEKPMMVSKYPDRQTGKIHWYCVKCRTSGPVAA